MKFESVIFDDMDYNACYCDKLHKFKKYLKIDTDGLVEIPIIVINLKQSTERIHAFMDNINRTNLLLKTHGFIFKTTRFDAIDGRNEKQLNECYIETEFNKNNSKYEYACTASHLLSIKYLDDNDIDMAIVCEDDSDIVNIAIYFEKFISYLNCVPTDWEVVQLVVGNGEFYNNTLFNIYKWQRNMYSTGCYIINRNGIDTILRTLFVNNKIYIPTMYINDCTADYIVYNTAKTYTTSLPFAMYPIDNTSTIHAEHLLFQQLSIRAAHEKLSKFDDIIKQNNVLKNDHINGFKKTNEYLLFISAGDNSIYLNDCISYETHNIDIVIYYYGDNERNMLTFKRITPFVYKMKNMKFDNFYHFYLNHKHEISKYKYLAVFDDDVILTKEKEPILVAYNKMEFTKNFKYLHELFTLCDQHQPWLCQPSCHNMNSINHTKTWWKKTHNRGTNIHTSNFIETQLPMFKIEFLDYIFEHYFEYRELDSWGTDLYFLQILKGTSADKILVFDNIMFINPSVKYKNILDREINLNTTEYETKQKYHQFISKYSEMSVRGDADMPYSPDIIIIQHQH